MRQILVACSVIIAFFSSGCVTERHGDKIEEDLAATKIHVQQLQHQVDDTQRAVKRRAVDEQTPVKVQIVEVVPASPRSQLVVLASEDRRLLKASQITNATELRGAFNEKHYAMVVKAAPRLIKAPKSGAKDEERYLFAESLCRLNRHKEAAREFRVLLGKEPHSGYVAKATLRLGDAELAMGRKKAARATYESLLRTEPDSPEATQARLAMRHLPSALSTH